MVISHNSQLGLRLNSKETALALLDCLKDQLINRQQFNERAISVLSKNIDENGTLSIELEESDPLYNELANYENTIKNHTLSVEICKELKDKLDLSDIILDKTSSYYFICQSVYKAANLIKITDSFTGRVLKDINFGYYTYLMGKNRCVKFQVIHNYVCGLYYDDQANKAFNWGIRMSDGGYFCDAGFDTEFTMIMQVLTFVELGDIEIIELEGGRNNGGKKNVNKITNTSNNTVYVVDSSWNKIIIRTDGFAVRGHFRLQPCGKNMADRILIWINAFEKHGYKRTPRAEIVR